MLPKVNYKIFMNKTFTLLLLASGLAFASMPMAQAQPKGRVATAKPMKNAFDKSPRMHTPAKSVGDPTDYGTEQTIVTEDFSKFATGSVDAPDFQTNINYQNDDNAWINLSDEYTLTPGWGSHYVYPAGGKAYMASTEDADIMQAQINTPMLDLSANQGIFFVEFTAYTAKEGKVSMNSEISAAETFNMGPTWTFLESYTIPEITNEPKTFRYIFYGGGKTTLVSLVTMGEDVVLDDVKVYQIDQYVGTPTALPHRRYKGDSFQARWNKAEGADSYLLDVYETDGAGNIGKYLKQDMQVADTACTVDGAESGQTYYYAVRSVKGDKQSIPSKPIEVTDLVAPKLGKVEVADGRYTAKWDAVPTAERYNYIAYFERGAKEDGKFVLTDENFDGVMKADSTQSGLTIENPDSYTYDQTFLKGIKQAGWKGKNYMPYTDYICLDAWQYLYNHSDAALISPEFDLSKDDGKVDVSLSLYGTLASYVGVDNNVYEGNVQCAVAMFNYNEQKEDYEQAELVYIRDTEAAWKNFDISLTTGTEKSKIGFFAVSYPDNLYIDNLKISQNYLAGETFLDPFVYNSYLENNETTVEIPAKANGADIYHQASSVKMKATSMYGGTEYESQWSPLELAANDVAAGIKDAKANLAGRMFVKVEGGNFVVSNPEGARIDVFTTSGSLVMSDRSGAKSVSVPVPQSHGAYIIKVGKKSVKTVF